MIRHLLFLSKVPVSSFVNKENSYYESFILIGRPGLNLINIYWHSIKKSHLHIVALENVAETKDDNQIRFFVSISLIT